MACKYIDRCPCICIRGKGKWDYERCIPFILTAYERKQNKLERCEDKLEKIKQIL